MQARADRTRRNILQAAAETFEARGYLGTSLQDVVAGTNVSKGALYFHFPSKEELALAILQEQRDLWPDLVSELRQHQSRTIRVLLELSFRVARTFHENVMVRASARLAYEHAQIGAAAPPLFDGWADMIEVLLDEAKAQGDLIREVDPRTVAEFIVAAFAGCQLVSESENRGADLPRRVQAMWRHLLPGLIHPSRLTEVMSALHALDHVSHRCGQCG